MNEKLRKGLIFGSFGVIAESILPIVTNSRPEILDPLYFAWFTLIFESIFIFPLMLIENHKNPSEKLKIPNISPSISKKKAIVFNIIIGFIFAFALILHFWALPISGAIMSSILLKSSLIYSMLIGVIFLKEKVHFRQVIFTIILISGLIFTLTEGFSTFGDVNFGALVILIVPLLWMIGHYFTKILMRNNTANPMQIVFSRTVIGSIVLTVFYLSIYPPQNFFYFLQWNNLLYLILGGIVYAAIHICWYKVLQYMDLSKSTVIYGLTPIMTSIFAILLLGEKITYYYVIGIITVVTAIFIIYYEKPVKKVEIDEIETV